MKKENSKRNGVGQFATGKSGNPSGRPPGALNKSTILMDSLFEDGSERVTQKLVALASKGNVQAMRLYFDRLPARKDRLIDMQLPPIETVGQFPAAVNAVIEAVCNGRMTPGEGERLTNIITIKYNFMAGDDINRRMEALEQKLFPDKATLDARQKNETAQIIRTLQEGRRLSAERKEARDAAMAAITEEAPNEIP